MAKQPKSALSKLDSKRGVLTPIEESAPVEKPKIFGSRPRTSSPTDSSPLGKLNHAPREQSEPPAHTFEAPIPQAASVVDDNAAAYSNAPAEERFGETSNAFSQAEPDYSGAASAHRKPNVAPPITAPQPTTPAEDDFYSDLERSVEDDEALQVRRERRSQQMHIFFQKAVTVFLIVGCVYLCFLIYGALNTQYVYKDGKLVPQQMTVEQIRKLDEFETVALEYRQARQLYEQVLCLDYRIAAGIEDPLLIAPEYEQLLGKINELAIQCSATTVSPTYAQLHSMIGNWVTKDIALYCQRMSSAISQNNSQHAAEALEYRTLMYNDFSIITANVLTLGQNVEGADVSDIQSWSPESFINKYIGDAGGALDG